MIISTRSFQLNFIKIGPIYLIFLLQKMNNKAELAEIIKNFKQNLQLKID